MWLSLVTLIFNNLRDFGNQLQRLEAWIHYVYLFVTSYKNPPQAWIHIDLFQLYNIYIYLFNIILYKRSINQQKTQKKHNISMFCL